MACYTFQTWSYIFSFFWAISNRIFKVFAILGELNTSLCSLGTRLSENLTNRLYVSLSIFIWTRLFIPSLRLIYYFNLGIIKVLKMNPDRWFGVNTFINIIYHSIYMNTAKYTTTQRNQNRIYCKRCDIAFKLNSIGFCQECATYLHQEEVDFEYNTSEVEN